MDLPNPRDDPVTKITLALSATMDKDEDEGLVLRMKDRRGKCGVENAFESVAQQRTRRIEAVNFIVSVKAKKETCARKGEVDAVAASYTGKKQFRL